MAATATGSWLWPSYQDGVSGAIGGLDPASPASTHVDHDGPVEKITCLLQDTSLPGSPRCCGAEDVRMPELSSDCSSPGTRQVDDDDEGSMVTANAPITPATWTYSSPLPKPKETKRRVPCKKRHTAMEAYNKGMLLQYIIESASDLDCCYCTPIEEDDYETKWKGHQPLTPNTGCIVSASEQRMMRRRLRRGVLSPARNKKMEPRLNGHFGGVLAKIPGSLSKDINSHFPGEVVDPHVCPPKEKWKPKL